MDKFILTAGRPTIIKDPDALLDYTLDLDGWLTPIGDSILSHECLPDEGSGLVVTHSEVVGNKIVAWISGGEPGQTARVVFRFQTTGGRTDDRSLFFRIRQR